MAFFPWGGNGDIGWEWVIHAERPGPSNPKHENFNYMGYSLQNECDEFKHLSEEEADVPNTAWLYTKQLTYAYAGFPEFGWNRSYFELATKDLQDINMTFRGAYKNDPYFLPERIEGGPMEPVAGVENVGKIGPEEFARELARSKMLVGIGQPWLAPSPYLALCLRTPYLNLLKRWDADDPDNRAKWDSQHNALMGMDSPYVYNVRAGDYDGFLAALRNAVQHPILEPYIDPEMTLIAMRTKVRDLVEADWQGMGKERWEKMTAEGRTLVG
ncbi:hypothetical protein P7C73_g5734, partial [Tremellales sp. Uapishka_1]